MHPALRRQIVSAIVEYTGWRLTDRQVEVVEDPRVDGTYAVRARGAEFLVRQFPLDDRRAGNIDVDTIEEVEFTSWPPRSSL